MGSSEKDPKNNQDKIIHWRDVLDSSALNTEIKDYLKTGKNYDGPFNYTQSHEPTEKATIEFELDQLEKTPLGQALLKGVKDKFPDTKVLIRQGDRNYVLNHEELYVGLSQLKGENIAAGDMLAHELEHFLLVQEKLKLRNEIYDSLEKKKAVLCEDEDLAKIITEDENITRNLSENLSKSIKGVNEFLKKVDFGQMREEMKDYNAIFNIIRHDLKVRVDNMIALTETPLYAGNLNIVALELLAKGEDKNITDYQEEKIKKFFTDGFDKVYKSLEDNYVKYHEYKSKYSIDKHKDLVYEAEGTDYEQIANDYVMSLGAIEGLRDYFNDEKQQQHNFGFEEEIYSMTAEHINQIGKSNFRSRIQYDAMEDMFNEGDYVLTSENIKHVPQNKNKLDEYLAAAAAADKDASPEVIKMVYKLLEDAKETWTKMYIPREDALIGATNQLNNILKDKIIEVAKEGVELSELKQCLKGHGVELKLDLEGKDVSVEIPGFYYSQDFIVKGNPEKVK